MSMQCVQYVLLFLVLTVNSKFTELHALTQATCSYAVIHIHTQVTHMAVDGLVGGISSRKNKKYDSSVQQDGSHDDQIVQVGTRHTHDPEGVKWRHFVTSLDPNTFNEMNFRVNVSLFQQPSQRFFVPGAAERIGGAQGKYKKWGPTKWIV